MDCSYCNKVVPEGSIFCPYCGRKLQIRKKCPNCGSVLFGAEVAFCNKCGARLEITNCFSASAHNQLLSMKDVVKVVLNSVQNLEQIDDYTSSGFARFQADGKYGILDTGGNIIIPPIYRYIYKYDENGKTIAVLDEEGYVRYTDVIKDGQILFRMEYGDFASWSGYVFHRMCDEQGEYFTLMNSHGKTLTDLRFYECSGFDDNGLCAVSTDPDRKTMGVINTSGQYIIPEVYPNYNKYDWGWGESHAFYEGLIRMKSNGKIGYMDTTGKVVVPFKFDNGGNFTHGAAAVKEDEKWGLIDKTGNWLIPPEYDYLEFGADNVAKVKKNGKYAFISRDNRLISDFVYDELGDFCEGFARVVVKDYYNVSNQKCGFINIEGKSLTEMTFRNCSGFNNGYAGVQNNNGKWGIIDSLGTVVRDYQYDNYLYFERCFAIVQKNGLYNILNMNLEYMSSKWWKDIEYDGCYILRNESETCQMNSKGEFYLHKVVK